MSLPRPNLIAWRDNPREKSRRKYANQPVEVDGLRFDSKAEANRWCQLKLLERTGHIRDLRRQVRYVLVPKQKRPSGGIEREKAYIADFVYTDCSTGREVCEDVKGAEPALWGWKRALMLHVHGVEVVVVKA